MLKEILNNRILTLDGAMGTMIQSYGLEEGDYRGNLFKNHPCSLLGNNDLLSLSQPNIISEIHDKYLLAGADIIETNTFSSTSISMADYKMESLVYKLNLESAKIAKKAAKKFTKLDSLKPRFVAGSIGPTNKTASMSSDVNNPGYRAINFDDLVVSYSEQIKGLIEGGVDVLLIETVFDTLNCKAALMAIQELQFDAKTQIPIFVSGTITDASGTHTYENVGVRLKGNSSMSHPGEKKPFKIDFNEFIVGQNHDGLKKLNFSNAFKDPSFLREKVFFDVSRSAGALAPRTNFANVYFNGELWGLYTVVEQIDDQFLDWTIGDDDGNLFKAGDDGADLRYLGLNQEAYEGVYEIKNNEEQNDWTDLLSLLDFVNDSSSEEFESQVEKYLDLDLFLRSAALDNLFSNLDSYTLSGRNYYLYHNMETDQWQWIKWDGNEAFGAFGYGVQESITELPVTFAGPGKILLERIFESAKLFQLYENEICGLLGTYFTPQYLHPMIDSLASLIESSVIMDENKMYSFQDFQSNINVDIVTEDPFLKEKEVRPGNTEWNPPQGNPPQGNQPPNREAPVMFGLKSFIDEKYAYLGQSLECESG